MGGIKPPCQADRFHLRSGPASIGDSEVPASLIIFIRIGSGVGLFDESQLRHVSEGTVEVSRKDLLPTPGSPLQLLYDAPTMTVSLGKDDENVEEDGFEGFAEVGSNRCWASTFRRLIRHVIARRNKCKLILIILTLAEPQRLRWTSSLLPFEKKCPNPVYPRGPP